MKQDRRLKWSPRRVPSSVPVALFAAWSRLRPIEPVSRTAHPLASSISN
jgi:hypothetical protein